METMTYTPARRDIDFVLFEHLKVQQCFGKGPYEDVGEEDAKMIIDYASTFAQDVLAPSNVAGDRIEAQWNDGKVTVPEVFESVWEQVKEQGWISLKLPPEHGGQGLPSFIGTVVDELFIGGNPAFAIHLGLSSASSNLLIHHGSEELVETYVPQLLSGEWQGTMCLTEAGAGSDVGASLTRATPVGDGSFKIVGTKIYISAGDHQLTENHIHLVLARLPDAPAGSKGLSLFLVPKFRLNDDGSIGDYNDVYCSKIESKMGIHASPTCVLNFGDNDDCIGWLIGPPQKGMRAMFQMMNEERIVVGLQGQALASAMYFHALKYSNERLQGSDIAAGKSISEEKVAIINHPDVRRMLMTVKAYAEGGRALLYYTSLQHDLAKLADSKEKKAYHKGIIALMTPICKAWGSDTGVEACSQALQIYGGGGFCTDFPAEQYLRDARIAPIYEGTNGIQGLDLLFRKVLGGGGKLVESFAGEVGAFIKGAAAGPMGAEAQSLGIHLKDLIGVTQQLGGHAQAGELREAALGATSYLAMFGNVVVGWLMLQQALIAQDKLKGFDIPTGDAERRQFLASNESARFYAGKVETTKFFIHQILSQNKWKKLQIASDDMSALDIVF